jgi:hypothetical protein
MENIIYLAAWVTVVSFLIFLLSREWLSKVRKVKKIKNGMMIIQLWDRIMISSAREYTLIFIFLIIIILFSFSFDLLMHLKF